MHSLRLALIPVGLLAVLGAPVLAAGAAPVVAAPPSWAPAATATVHPGVQTYTEGAQCTANFVYYHTDPITFANTVFIGQAAHCAGTGAATDTNGCDAGSLPLGTKVEVDGASQLGTIVYSSWLAMQAKGETDPDTCAYNDLALIQLAPADVAKTNPSVPYWGGPTGLATTTSTLEDVYSYGNSSLRFGLAPLSPKRGYSLGTEGNGWSHTVYTVTPGIPGDSGSGFLNESGAAFGTLSTVAILPLPASNGVGDLSRELAYARSNSSFTALTMAPGTEPFTPLP
jgi:hypothetical protein